MTPSDAFISAPSVISTPAGEIPEGQPAWNKQRNSQMATNRYLPYDQEVQDFQLKDSATASMSARQSPVAENSVQGAKMRSATAPSSACLEG